MHRKYLLVSVSAAALLLQAQPVIAQGVTDVIVVTAQKKEQSSQDVGIAMTAFDSELIQNLGFEDSVDVAALSPSVQINYANGLSSFSFNVRGVTQTDFSDHQEAPVAVYVDDVYVSQMAGVGFQLFDAERVEVLRGPQGTLFGRNATGGLLHFITKKPSEELSGYAQVSYGSFDQASVEGAIGGALAEGLSARASLRYEQNDGYIENLSGPDGNEQNSYSGRLQFLAQLGDNADLLINFRGAQNNVDTPQYWKNAAANVGPTGVGVFTNGDVSGDVHQGSWNLTGGYRIRTLGTSATLTMDIGDIDVTAITDYNDLEKTYLSDADEGANTSLLHFGGDNHVTQFSQEIRVGSSVSSNIDWVVGGYFLDIDGEYKSTFVAPFTVAAVVSPAFNAIYNEFETDTQSWALFGQADLKITPQLTLTAGLRWTKEEKKHFFSNNAVNVPDVLDPLTVPLDGLLPIGAFNPTLNGEDALIDDDFWSAKAALTWKPTDDMMYYASWNRGVKAGSFNAPVFTLPASEMKFANEVLDAYELGFKASFFDNKLRLNGAVFYYDYGNIQAYQLEGFTQILRNKDGNTKGAEIEIAASPSNNLDFLLGVSYLDAVINDVSAGLSTINARPQMTPKWNVSGLARYQWDAFGGTMSAVGDFVYLDDHYFDIANSDVVKQKGYLVGNLRLSYRTLDERWELSAFVDNIGDKSYATWAYDIAAFAGVIEKTYAKPRWWGVSLRYALN
ncbi:TonB-dependent receptor [Parasphingorhabdus sp.]|uniref:TonB-dependent receptor n=1 Tax=Parasphingorhabdus sp. TaxID=2709688 RepID=UPI003A8EB53F